jgi:hypothetical protein
MKTRMGITCLLWALEVPVYDLVLVEVVHACGDLLGPLNQLLGRDVLPCTRGRTSGSEDIEEVDDDILSHLSQANGGFITVAAKHFPDFY